MIILVLRWIITIAAAFLCGKLVAKVKLPAILGWLLAGMILGPYAFDLLPNALINTWWYKSIINLLECTVGLMIGTELVYSQIINYGKALIITTVMQSLGTFILVSIVFYVVFFFSGIPTYLAFIFGGIALATAPAPALSIVREFKTSGPVTKTLIPMAALDDIIGVIIFFTTIALVLSSIPNTAMPIYFLPLMIILPLLIGFIFGYPAGKLLSKVSSKSKILVIICAFIFFTTLIGSLCNTYMMPSPLLNFMLMGMSFSATFANIVSEKQLEIIKEDFSVLLNISIIIVILNLGAPLDYHAIYGAGFFTILYIISRGFGKYFGARFGAKVTNMPTTVQKYLGFTLLPHSGVSLVFTGIAVSMLTIPAPEEAKIIQGTIAAAAIINELIAVIMAKKGFEWANELNKTT